jgi:pyruvate formate lyase activating enzyme
MLDRNVSGVVFNVQKFSVHDGKGIRTLVFLKGCPLRCKWCSNPESQRLEPERAFNPTRCLTASVCGRCVAACPSGAMSVKEGLLLDDRNKCTECFACVEACPSGAQRLYGENQTVDQVLSRVEEDGVFYARSGGGVTLSGGEAMVQPDFVLALLREAKARRINSSMETCGHYGWDNLREACTLLNSLIFDLKHLDTAKHREFTGVGNELILKNFQRVCDQFPALPLTVRTPVIPGFNDSAETIAAIRDFIPKRPNVTYELLPYHRMGQPKYGYIGKHYEFEGIKLEDAVMKRLQKLVENSAA